MKLRRTLQWLVVLSVLGLGVSLYLTWVYTADSTPICLGSSGCATVQHSPYAWIAGIPIPTLGALAYATLLALGLLALRTTSLQATLILALFGLSLTGVLFSAYLTYLELFVIRAICQWCVVSAIIMVGVFLLSLAAHRQYSHDEEA